MKEYLKIDKYYHEKILDINEEKWYHVQNPKKVELEHLSCEIEDGFERNICNIILENQNIFNFTYFEYHIEKGIFLKFYGRSIVKKIYYLNDETFLLEFGFERGGIESGKFMIIDIKNQNQDNLTFFCQEVLFCNEEMIVYFMELDYGPAHNWTVKKNYCYNFLKKEFYNYEVDDEDDEEFYGPFFEKRESDFLINKELLLFEIQKRYSFNLNFENLSYSKPEKSDIKIKIKLTNEEIEYPLYKLQKINSDLINEQLSSGEQIYLPISKLDTSLECLDFLRAKYLDVKLLKMFIRELI